MSHITTTNAEITDLDALAQAVAVHGLELRQGQTTYHWYGRHMEDYPLPAGFGVQDLGQCEHAIVVPNSAEAYEIGLARRRDGRPGWTLMYDFWRGGYGLMQHAGPECRRIVHEYAAVVAKKRARTLGHAVQEVRRADGSIQKLTILGR